MRSEAAIKTCRCGLAYTVADYLALPAPPKGETAVFAGDEGQADQILLYRNCPCGQTMVVDLERVS